MDEIVPLSRLERLRGYAAYAHADSRTFGKIHLTDRENLARRLAAAERSGWNAPGTGSVRGLVTHETAHAIFHQLDLADAGGPVKQWKIFLAGQNTSRAARDRALDAAVTQAKRDGIGVLRSNPEPGLARYVSGYARDSWSREELEAEMFSIYHWGTNPPEFVKVWGRTLHRDLGFNPRPFREVVARRGR